MLLTIFLFACASLTAVESPSSIHGETRVIEGRKARMANGTFDTEASIFSNMDFYRGLSIFLVFVSAAVTGSVGLSSASLTVGLVMFGFQLHEDEAIRLVNMATLATAIVNNIFVISVRREDNPDELYLDWGLGSYCLPQVFAGSMVGLFLKDVLPEGYGYIVTSLVVLILSLTSNREAKRIEIHEESGFHSNLSDRTLIRITDSSAHFFKNLTSVARSSLLEISSQNIFPILVINFSALVMILGNLVRKWPAAQAAIGINSCSVITFAVFLVSIVMISYLSYCAKQRIQTSYNPQRQFTLILASFWSGIFLLLNPSGSVVFWLSLLTLGMEPMTIWAVSSSQLFYSSIGAAIQDVLITPPKDYIGIGAFAGIGALGALLGNFFIQKRFKKFYGAQSIVGKIGCLVGFLALTVMCFNGDQARQDNANFWKVGNLC